MKLICNQYLHRQTISSGAKEGSKVAAKTLLKNWGKNTAVNQGIITAVPTATTIANGVQNKASPGQILSNIGKQQLELLPLSAIFGTVGIKNKALSDIDKANAVEQKALATADKTFGKSNGTTTPTSKRPLITLNGDNTFSVKPTEKTPLITPDTAKKAAASWKLPIDDQSITAAKAKLATAEPVSELHGDEFAKSEIPLKAQVDTYYKSIGNKATNPVLGNVDLNLRGIKDSLGHGMTRNKAIAFKALPDVIKKRRHYQLRWELEK